MAHWHLQAHHASCAGGPRESPPPPQLGNLPGQTSYWPHIASDQSSELPPEVARMPEISLKDLVHPVPDMTGSADAFEKNVLYCESETGIYNIICKV